MIPEYINAALEKAKYEIIKDEDLVSPGIRAYIKSELGKIEAQLHYLYHKYGIKSTADLEHAIEKGTVVESDVFEDLTRIDYLEDKKSKLLKFIRTI